MPGLTLLGSRNGTIDRVPYLLAGAGLFALKYLLDVCFAAALFGRTWSPVNYLIWPNDQSLPAFSSWAFRTSRFPW